MWAEIIRNESGKFQNKRNLLRSNRKIHNVHVEIFLFTLICFARNAQFEKVDFKKKYIVYSYVVTLIYSLKTIYDKPSCVLFYFSYHGNKFVLSGQSL